MIKSEAPENIALLNYDYVNFHFDTKEEALKTLNEIVDKITGFKHNLTLKKSVASPGEYIFISKDIFCFNELFKKRLILYHYDKDYTLQIQIRKKDMPIEYTMELADALYKKEYHSTSDLS